MGRRNEILFFQKIKYYSIKPNFIIHYNLVSSLNKYMFHKYSFILFYFFYLFWILKIILIDYKIYTKCYLTYEEKNKKNSYEFYYNLSKIPFSKKKIISLKGKGISSFFLTNNISLLQKKIV